MRCNYNCHCTLSRWGSINTPSLNPFFIFSFSLINHCPKTMWLIMWGLRHKYGNGFAWLPKSYPNRTLGDRIRKTHIPNIDTPIKLSKNYPSFLHLYDKSYDMIYSRASHNHTYESSFKHFFFLVGWIWWCLRA